MLPTKETYDCVVIGAGPAGCTAAALVARAGFSVLLVERESLPREHVGESLMPETWRTFERLGVLDKLRASRFPKKVGVQFVNHTGKESKPFFFRQHDDRDCAETWHVERATFDKMLYDHAEGEGVECLDGVRVLEVAMVGDRTTGVKLQAKGGATAVIGSSVVVDASGQSAMLAGRLGLKRVNPDLKKSAIWRHYRGAHRDESGGGVKTIILHTDQQKSWFWYIPQSDDIVSVGVVGDNDYLLKGRGKPAQIFEEEIAKCDGVVSRLVGAEPLDDLAVAKEFSYSTDRPSGDGWVLVGDAWGFIDPVYSSGVYFAMLSADMASDCIIDALRAKDPSAERLGAWAEEFSMGTKWVRKLVTAFYSGEFRVGKFAMDHPEHVPALTDLLIGRMFSPAVPRMFEDLDPWLERAIAESDRQSDTADDTMDGGGSVPAIA
ncbi:putative FAD-dependent oxidoreductase LodB [Pseudobythopirellula maris]|uniref:Putative FAD-dependent oxidoreductase LodB n=1 Tax=Pseudobythopirellula maris TaxID=2527991 RepID=A0A5C5ZJA9_9BACT|nr:NAD(P)/FAD-dependent oxidoreductase [Pseudobythopirellula maris]TWT87439.1 putative FAD-dependent oxidoreductase LodB [Pseudobythopirellula maris]